MRLSCLIRPGQRFQSERGDALIEFALTFIVLMLMLFGIVEFSRALYTYHFVSYAAREATRWASVNGATCNSDSSCNGTAPMNNGPASPTDIQNYVTTYLIPPGIDSANVTTTTTWTAPTGSPPDCATTQNDPGCTIEVTVSYPFSFVAPIVSTATVTMSSTSEMVIAH
jgi:Flp pilus assembly protein TadG